MTQEPPTLHDRRIVIVTGKGGTGKTTVAAALALAASRDGQRVLLAELARDEQLPRLFEKSPRPVGSEGRELYPGIHAIRIDPFDAMEEYLRLQGGAGALLARGLRRRGLHDLLLGTPGWRELITLGKLWYLEQQTLSDGSPRYDLLIVDAPATGHGLTLLDVPRVVHSAVRTGPLARNAARVEAMLRNPEETVLLPVCLPEELPVRETIELVERMTANVGVTVDRVVVNAVASPSPADPWPDLPERLWPGDEWLAESEHPGALVALPAMRTLASCTRWALNRSSAHRRALAALAEHIDLPLVELPHMPGGTLQNSEPDLDRLAELGRRLLPENGP